ncbi:MAG TPA: 2OG-Fe(II) oxygenase [Puia sp.]
MQKIFDTLINGFIETKVGIAERFLSEALVGHLAGNLTRLYDEKLLLTGGTSNEESPVFNKLLRNDVIYWLDRKHDNPYENEFLTLIETFISYLNSTCYTGITGYEFHYTLYEKGAFYKRHLDQFRNNSSRQYSMIIYLNSHWKDSDGGQLLIHQKGKAYALSPTSGKSVFFKSSELEHEVLMTNKPRMSITGWLKRD